LSLFDGISSGQIALERAGIKINNYYASEIDEYSISITMKNYPNTIQVGNVLELTETEINKLPIIDLLIGGSPCQDLSSSNVGSREGLKGEKSIGINV
jgi:site-specific DNA-cytosine methylase